MTSEIRERGPREGVQAIQRNLEGLSRSIQSACHGATQNASSLVSFMQSQRLHLISRTAPFAAASLQFGRAADSGSKSKKRRKANDEGTKASKEKSNNLTTSSTEEANVPKPKPSQQSQAELEAQKQKLKEDEQERRKEEKRQANERRRQEAEARKKAADERKQEAKRQQEEAIRKQQQEQQNKEDKEKRSLKGIQEKEDKAYQDLLLEELKGIVQRRSKESDFVRSLDDVEITEHDLQEGHTLTGLRPVTKEQLSEEHDEMMRDVLAEMGADAESALEDKTLSQLLDEAERERARKEMSADEPGIRKKSRQELYDEMPGEDLRPHAPKMELRIHEHEALELDRFGEGHFFHPKRLLGIIPWGVVHDFSWGMFGRIPVVQERLGPKWGAKDPEVILQRQDYYDDILNIAPEMEMTVMMVAERDIPLAELRNKLLDIQHIRLRQTMYNEDELKPLPHNHKVLLAKIKLSAMEDSFRNCGLMDNKGNIKEDSKLVLVVTEDGALTAEAVTPGSIIEQKIIRLGRWTDTTFARSVMDNFLGVYPADNRGKNSVGHGVLYCANGFDYRPPGKGNPYQFYDSPPRDDIPDELSRPQPQEGLIITPDIFTVEKKHPFIVEDLSKAAKRTNDVAQVAS